MYLLSREIPHIGKRVEQTTGFPGYHSQVQAGKALVFNFEERSCLELLSLT